MLFHRFLTWGEISTVNFLHVSCMSLDTASDEHIIHCIKILQLIVSVQNMFQLMFCQVEKEKFFRKDRPIPPFNTSLKHATFQLSETNTTCINMVTQNGIDFMWLLQTFTNTTPLYYGYLSRYVRDHPPCTLVTYMDHISLPPTKNNSVCETMDTAMPLPSALMTLN